MKVDGQLEGAQLKNVRTTVSGGDPDTPLESSLSAAEKATGAIFYNKEEDKIKVSDSAKILQKVGGSDLVGDIKTSVLTQADFMTVTGGGWALADGASSLGTDYFALTGKATLPDLRGTFLRGENAGRSDSWADPAGAKIIGSNHFDGTRAPRNVDPLPTTDDRQGIRFGTGSGSGPFVVGNVGTTLSPLGAIDYTSAEAPHGHTVQKTGGGWDDDTTPYHTVVNYYIKVNS